MSFSSTRQEQSKVTLATRAAVRSRAVFFTAITFTYAAAIVLATLTLNPYFSQTWDVGTFIHAARALFDGNPFDLYAQSRAAQTWPYAYPPLHAFAVALALFISDVTRALPDYVWARVPSLLSDLGTAMVLYAIVRRRSNDETISRAAALLWLFNPVTFYDTAVQGHFEGEWLLFVLLAYAWLDNPHSMVLPSIAIAIAVLFKQTAIVFAIPMWVYAILGMTPASPPKQHLLRFLLSLLLFGLIVGMMCLPFLLYSDDFLYMNLTYVENVPVQTQSWIVALLSITRTAPDAMTSDFFLLRWQSIVTIAAAMVIAFFGVQRGWNLYLTATLVAIAFFLTSKKVMGYYYVMLFPFLLAEVLPRRRFDLALIAIVATTWISLAPYYAAWGNHAHGWIYAVLGLLNSAFFVWFSMQLLPRSHAWERAWNLRVTVFVPLSLFAGAGLAMLLQPFAPNNGSPLRAPIIAPGMESNALVAFGMLVALIAIALIILARATRGIGGTLPHAAWSIVLMFAPLFFSVYYLTKESTAILEIALKALGV